MPQLGSVTRRRLCKIVGAFFLGNLVEISVTAAAQQPPKSIEKLAFAAFLDTLLPGEQFSGSATELHVDREIWAFAATDAQFRKLLGIGCQWLDMTGGSRFADLETQQRIAVLTWMAQSDWNQIPRRFYELLRQLSLELYYSRMDSWGGLPIQSPPQPRGYPPPWP